MLREVLNVTKGRGLWPCLSVGLDNLTDEDPLTNPGVTLGTQYSQELDSKTI